MSRIVDLYCCAGGASYGYWAAGWEVVGGIDLEPQPNYPFSFSRGDVLKLTPKYLRQNFDAVHASPPCQAHSELKHIQGEAYSAHLDLIPQTRELLTDSGLPYIIENVPGAPLLDPVMCCGSAFGLRVRRHRSFESNFELVGTECDHDWQDEEPIYLVNKGPSKGARNNAAWSGVMPVHGTGSQLCGGNDLLHGRQAMGISWMTRGELSQAIPPAYTQFLGAQLLRVVR